MAPYAERQRRLGSPSNAILKRWVFNWRLKSSSDGWDLMMGGGGKVVPDGRRGIGEASIDYGWSVNWLVKVNCGGWTKVVGNMAAMNELVEIGRVGCG